MYLQFSYLLMLMEPVMFVWLGGLALSGSAGIHIKLRLKSVLKFSFLV